MKKYTMCRANDGDIVLFEYDIPDGMTTGVVDTVVYLFDSSTIIRDRRFIRVEDHDLVNSLEDAVNDYNKSQERPIWNREAKGYRFNCRKVKLEDVIERVSLGILGS